ncbi:hypothetical protein OG579_09785 [Williamsia herbipolensis]|uniref:Uncharacterized protein n=1 Tax=Williamsia herbipolensis TaxID=1603258 RepID=A0AAU4K7I5_9NOCA|nr:hypothetical protein [Williamsia herbipolensis]
MGTSGSDDLRDVEPIEGRPWISRISTPSSRVRIGIAIVGVLAIIGVAVPLFISLFSGGDAPDAAAPSTTASPVGSVVRSAEPMYSSPGECISLTKEPAGIVPAKADCGASQFTFIVATALQSSSGDCGVGHYSQLTQPGFGKLCILPNFTAGQCYLIPGARGTLVDFRRAQCDSSATIRVAGRVAAPTIDCPGGETISFSRPSPLTYCLTAPR